MQKCLDLVRMPYSNDGKNKLQRYEPASIEAMENFSKWNAVGSIVKEIGPVVVELFKILNDKQNAQTERERDQLKLEAIEAELRVEAERNRLMVEMAARREQNEVLQQLKNHYDEQVKQMNVLLQQVMRLNENDEVADLVREKEARRQAEKRCEELQFAENLRRSVEDEELNCKVDNSLEGNYEIQNDLGKGAFGKVYLVKHRRSGDLFAAKTMALENDDLRRNEVRRELAAMGSIPTHRNIVQFIEVLQDDFRHQTVIIYEYCDGGNLNDFIIAGGVSVNEKISIMNAIFAAMAHIHKHNVLHLDLKPDNILLKDGIVKLSDFGIAKAFSRSRYEAASLYYFNSCGVLNMPRYYRPPEIFLAEDINGGAGVRKVTTFKVDVYQAGCMFLALLLESQVPWNDEKKLLAPFLRTNRGILKDLAQAQLDEMDVEHEIYERLPQQVRDNNALVKLLHSLTDYSPEKRPEAKDVYVQV